jgi:hypothetical protein
MIKRAAFLYFDPKGDAEERSRHAQCSTCMMWTSNAGANPLRCHIHGKKLRVHGDDTCGLYVHGKPMPKGPVMKLVSTKESGFLRHTEVRCENCAHFSPAQSRCGLYEQLNKLRRFELDADVHPQGCCNAWEEDDMPASEIMSKFKKGSLRSSSGHKVTNPAQARAIAHSYGSEGDKPKRKKKGKVSGMLRKYF